MNEQPVSGTLISARDLKAKLSAAYFKSRASSIPNFLELWDLKELAILERQETVEVPNAWLSSLDSTLKEIEKSC